MPESNSQRGGIIWRLSKAHEVGQLVRVRCGYCLGWRYYMPADLQRVLGDIEVQRIPYRIRCERCNRGDQMTAEVFIPVAAERARMTVRRLVDIKVHKVPVGGMNRAAVR